MTWRVDPVLREKVRGHTRLSCDDFIHDRQQSRSPGSTWTMRGYRVLPVSPVLLAKNGKGRETETVDGVTMKEKQVVPRLEAYEIVHGPVKALFLAALGTRMSVLGRHTSVVNLSTTNAWSYRISDTAVAS